jgi:hypothetical protein
VMFEHSRRFPVNGLASGLVGLRYGSGSIKADDLSITGQKRLGVEGFSHRAP